MRAVSLAAATVLSIVALFAVPSQAAPPALHLGFLLPVNGSTLEAEAQCWATALDIGVHRVNNDATLLPDTHVVGRTENSGGVPGTAAVSVVSLMCAASGQVPGTACNTSSVIIGPYQDDTTLTSQSVAAYFTVPQVSPTASTPALNKEADFPSLNRLTSPVQAEGAVAAAIVEAAGWSSVNALYSGHPFDIAAAERFTDLLHKNVTVRASSMLLKRNNEDATSPSNPFFDLDGGIEAIKSSGSYIVFLSVRLWDIESVFKALAAEHMLGEPWVYIVPSWVTQAMQFFGEMRALYQGVLCLYPPPVNTSSAEYMHFSAAWAARDVGCQARSKPAHTDALFYDSVVLAARGYDKAIAVATSLRGPNAVPTHGETLSAIRATEFTGATGKVSLTSYGAREARMLVGYMPTVLLEQELHPVDVGRFLPGQGLQIDFSSVVWPGGGTSMPPSSAPPLQQSAWLLGIGIGICCVATVEALVFATSAFYFRRHKVMSSSSPVFMVAICVGAAIGCVAIFFRLLAPLSESTCALVMWLPTVSTVVVIACLLAKTHRVHRLFTNSSLQKVVVSDRDVAYRIAAVVVPWLGLLAAWQLLAPWVPMQALTEPDERGMQYTYTWCDSHDGTSIVWEVAAACGLLVLLGAGSYLAFETRNVPAGFNESRWILLSIFNTLVVFSVGGALQYVLRENPSAQLVLRPLGVLEPAAFTLAALFVPKLYNIYLGRVPSDRMHRDGSQKNSSNDHGRAKFIPAEVRAQLRTLQSQVVKLRRENTQLNAQLSQSPLAPRQDSEARDGAFATANPLRQASSRQRSLARPSSAAGKGMRESRLSSQRSASALHIDKASATTAAVLPSTPAGAQSGEDTEALLRSRGLIRSGSVSVRPVSTRPRLASKQRSSLATPGSKRLGSSGKSQRRRLTRQRSGGPRPSSGSAEVQT